MNKPDAKLRLLRWVLLLQKHDINIIDKKGVGNVAADHLSRLEELEMSGAQTSDIEVMFPEEHLLVVVSKEPCYADYVNFLAAGILLKGMTNQQRKNIFVDVTY